MSMPVTQTRLHVTSASGAAKLTFKGLDKLQAATSYDDLNFIPFSAQRGESVDLTVVLLSLFLKPDHSAESKEGRVLV